MGLAGPRSDAAGAVEDGRRGPMEERGGRWSTVAGGGEQRRGKTEEPATWRRAAVVGVLELGCGRSGREAMVVGTGREMDACGRRR